MLKKQSLLWAVLLTAAVAGSALAQPPGGGRGGPGGRGPAGRGPGMGGVNWPMSAMGLLNAEQVQEEINLAGDKAEEIAETMRESMREVFGAFRGGPGGGGERPDFEEMRKRMEEARSEMAKKLEELLDDSQAKRLHEIARQAAGVMAVVTDPEDSKALELGDDEQAKLETVQEEMNEGRRELFEAMRDGLFDREEMGAEMAKLTSEADEKVKTALNSDQVAKLNELMGEPFAALEEVRQNMRGPGGGRGFGGGRGSRGGPGGGGRPGRPQRGGDNDA